MVGEVYGVEWGWEKRGNFNADARFCVFVRACVRAYAWVFIFFVLNLLFVLFCYPSEVRRTGGFDVCVCRCFFVRLGDFL